MLLAWFCNQTAPHLNAIGLILKQNSSAFKCYWLAFKIYLCAWREPDIWPESSDETFWKNILCQKIHIDFYIWYIFIIYSYISFISRSESSSHVIYFVSKNIYIYIYIYIWTCLFCICHKKSPLPPPPFSPPKKTCLFCIRHKAPQKYTEKKRGKRRKQAEKKKGKKGKQKGEGWEWE